MLDQLMLLRFRSMALNLSIARRHLKLNDIEAADQKIFEALLKLQEAVNLSEHEALQVLSEVKKFKIE